MGQQINLPGEKHRQMIVFEDTDIKQLEDLIQTLKSLISIIEKSLHDAKANNRLAL